MSGRYAPTETGRRGPTEQRRKACSLSEGRAGRALGRLHDRKRANAKWTDRPKGAGALAVGGDQPSALSPLM